MTVRATYFRKNLFRYLDECRDSGDALIIERGKERFHLEAEQPRFRLGALPAKPWVIRDPDSLADFSPAQWRPDDLS